MKRLAVILTAMITIGISQVSMAQKNLFGNHTITESSAKTATKKGPVLVKSLRLPKNKIFTGNPHKITLFADDKEYDIIEVDDIITSYRRRDLQRIQTDPTPDDPDGLITEEIRWKLFLARTAAMIRYHQIHS